MVRLLLKNHLQATRLLVLGRLLLPIRGARAAAGLATDDTAVATANALFIALAP